MANYISHERRQLILRLLCEGNSVRSTSRVTGAEKKTVLRAIVTFGGACKRFLDERMRGLALDHLECDEQWTYVAKKQANLTVEEREDCADRGDVYLWTAFDQRSKLVPTFALGKRSADNARRFMTDLASRLVMPNPHATDAHGYRPARPIYITQISTDGFPGYPEAVDLAFGPYAKFGTIIKEYRNARMQYDPSEMVGTRRNTIRGLDGDELSICTSHVERHNGTNRLFMKRLNRLTYCFSKKLENLEAAVAMHMANYNFCWRCRFPDGSGKAGRRRPPAAMMAGITDRLWSFADLYNEVLWYG